MNQQQNRRDVLKRLALGGSLAIGSVGNSIAAPDRRVNVVEAGIRYDVPHVHNAVEAGFHSRPPYTIDDQGSRLIILGASSSYESEIAARNSLVDEQAMRNGSSEIGQGNRVTNTIPTSLTSRKRVSHAVKLASSVRLPRIVVHWNPNAPAANVESVGRVDLEPGSSTEIRLEQEPVEIKTRTITNELPDKDDVPDVHLALKREDGSEIVDATPIVEIAHRGELTLDRATPPPENRPRELGPGVDSGTTTSGQRPNSPNRENGNPDTDNAGNNGHGHGHGHQHSH